MQARVTLPVTKFQLIKSYTFIYLCCNQEQTLPELTVGEPPVSDISIDTSSDF